MPNHSSDSTQKTDPRENDPTVEKAEGKRADILKETEIGGRDGPDPTGPGQSVRRRNTPLT